MANLHGLRRRQELEEKRLQNQVFLDKEATGRAKRIEQLRLDRLKRTKMDRLIINAIVWGAVITIGFIAAMWFSVDFIKWINGLGH